MHLKGLEKVVLGGFNDNFMMYMKYLIYAME